MSDFASPLRDRDSRHALIQRLAAAATAAQTATERYIEIRRECDLSVVEARDLVAASQDLREQLRSVVASYVSVLRRDGSPPERVVILVKQAVDASDLSLEPSRRRALMEEVVRWAVDAYYAA